MSKRLLSIFLIIIVCVLIFFAFFLYRQRKQQFSVQLNQQNQPVLAPNTPPPQDTSAPSRENISGTVKEYDAFNKIVNVSQKGGDRTTVKLTDNASVVRMEQGDPDSVSPISSDQIEVSDTIFIYCTTADCTETDSVAVQKPTK